jgi:predicted ArsR family transcriptional regulator
MPKPTRQRILDFLTKYTSSSAEEISDALSMTKENIQYHLKRLRLDGFIELDMTIKNNNKIRGRPTLFYRLAGPVYPSNINHLAGCLLQFLLKDETTNNGQKLLLGELARLMFKPAGTLNLSQALQLAVRQLNEHHYRASWEARLKSPRIIFKNCPYAALLKDYPELCNMDMLILETLVGNSVQQIARKQFGRSGSSICVFELNAR